MRLRTEERDAEQVRTWLRDLAEAVDELILHLTVVLLCLDGGDPLVDVELLRLVRDIGIRDECVDIAVDLGIEARLLLQLALLLLHGGVQQLTVQIVADGLHVAMLLCAQDIARTADLEVTHRDPDARAELGELADRLQALLRLLRQHLTAAVHEERVRRPVRASDTSANLIQLTQAHPVRVLDDHRICIRDVEASLDDRRRHQHIDLAVDEAQHDILELRLRHLAMRIRDARLRAELLHMPRDVCDVIDPVVDIVHLAVSRKLAVDRLAHELVVVLHDIGLDRHTVDRRLLEHRHVTDADQRHVQRPRDRRRRQRQHVDVFLQILDALLMRHAEALLLVDDQKAEVPELDVLTEQTVGANDDIDTAGLQVVEGLSDLLRCPEAAQQRDVHREALHTLDEGVVDLLREDGGRHEVGHLLTVLHGLEGGAQCDLGLTVADVTADQAVHDLMALHVVLHRFDGEVLVDRLLVREHLLELLLPDGIRPELVAGLRLPRRIELYEVTCDLLYSMLHT